MNMHEYKRDNAREKRNLPIRSSIRHGAANREGAKAREHGISCRGAGVGAPCVLQGSTMRALIYGEYLGFALESR